MEREDKAINISGKPKKPTSYPLFQFWIFSLEHDLKPWQTQAALYVLQDLIEVGKNCVSFHLLSCHGIKATAHSHNPVWPFTKITFQTSQEVSSSATDAGLCPLLNTCNSFTKSGFTETASQGKDPHNHHQTVLHRCEEPHGDCQMGLPCPTSAQEGRVRCSGQHPGGFSCRRPVLEA